MITTVKNLKPLMYELYTPDPKRPYDRITLERTSDTPERWAIVHGPFYLSKKSKMFEMGYKGEDVNEDTFYKEFRFGTPKEGLVFWNDTFSTRFFSFEQNVVVWRLMRELDKRYKAECTRQGYLKIGVPSELEFGDGDPLNIKLKKEIRRGGIQWFLTDGAATISHLSIWTEDEVLECETSDKAFVDLCNKNGVNLACQEFEMETDADHIAEDMKKFTDVLMELVNSDNNKRKGP